MAVVAVMALSGVASLAVPVQAHVNVSQRPYEGFCETAVLLARGIWDGCPRRRTVDDPTGGQLCADTECEVGLGGATWSAVEVIKIHDGILGDGLDVRASIEGEANPVVGWICVAQETSPTDPDGTVCNDPESEPDRLFCGTSGWLDEAVVPPFESEDLDGDGDRDRPDWVGVFVGGPASAALQNAPEPVGDCDGPGGPPEAMPGSVGEVSLRVRG